MSTIKPFRIIGVDPFNTFRYKVNTIVNANSSKEALAIALNKKLDEIEFMPSQKYYIYLWAYEVTCWDGNNNAHELFQIRGDSTII